MKRQHWLLLLFAGLAVILCCCVAVAGMAGFLSWQVIRTANSPQPAVLDRTSPAPNIVRRQPSSTDQETARLASRTALPQRDLADLAHRLQGRPELPAGPSPTQPDREFGESETFWVNNTETNSFFTATATLGYVTPHAYWWVENGYDVSSEDLKRSALNFEDRTYPTNRRLFGGEWSPGVDGDPHVFIFLGNVPGVGGYFSGPDEYPASISAHSNEHEMFYINLDNAMPGNDYFDGVLAHEFQHMIHWAMDRNEDGWVSEGLSELAVQLNGYEIGGSDLAFSASPDTQLNTWPELEDSSPHYGASYVFMAYFLDQYGEEAIQRLVAEPANGIAGFDAVLKGIDPAGRRFDQVFADWIVANYLDEPGLAGGRYGYADLHMHTPGYAALHTTYPVREELTVRQYAADYVVLEGQGDFTVEFTGSLVVPLVGNEVHSGDFQWWSNRGDDGDVTLTRAFDLTGLQEATLQAWMWYDLETDYDYGYVEVSGDGGDTWTLLANEHTSATSPTDSNFGPGFTGLSGGGESAAWGLESFDLSPYAGVPILVRFEVVTDDAVNHPGLCLDDISISELGYTYDVEGGEDGWLAQGWVRVSGYVPQHFVVQLITLGRTPQVVPMAPDENMHGLATVTGLDRGSERAVLVVAGTTPVTTELASYRYQITRP